MSNNTQKSLDDLLKGKNPEQCEAIKNVTGPMLITASAGSGKTTVLINRIGHLLLLDVNPTSIFVITFTNKAANEIKDRLRDEIGEKADYVNIGTFHSMFREHILMKYSDHHFFTDIGLDMSSVVILDDKDADKIYKDAYDILPLRIREKIDDGRLTMSTLHNNISLGKANGYDVEDYIQTFNTQDGDFEEKEATALLWKNYRDLCYEQNQIDFDDMLVLSHKFLHNHPEVATELGSRFKFVMVDEYQDTSRVQMYITDAIAMVHNNICVVGDEKQSIYGWRGSDITVILDFKKRYENVQILSMFRNYRSERNIINVANAVADAMTERLTDGQLLVPETKQDTSPLKYVTFPDVETEAAYITKAIKRDIQKGIPGSEIAIIYRNKNIKNELEKNLVSEQVPYTLIGDTSFFQRKEVKDAISMIRFIFQPWDSQAGLRFLDATSFGISSASARKAMKSDKLPVFQYLIKKSEEMRGNGTPTKVAEKAKALIDVINRLKSAQELGASHEVLGEYLSNFWDLYLKGKHQLAAKKSTSNEAQSGYESKLLNVEEVIKQFVIQYAQSYDIKKTIDEMTLRISNIPELDSERDKKIQLLTIHASKGLEFDTLYFMGVDNESFLGTAKNVDKSEQEESRRLFYVGITRGKNKVVFTKPQQRMQIGETLSLTELSFINEIRERQIENGIPLVEEIEISDSVLKDKYRNNHYNYRGNYANSR
jgi:DNA helicase-2/ATP-dependent DNA helicase PcrA